MSRQIMNHGGVFLHNSLKVDYLYSAIDVFSQESSKNIYTPIKKKKVFSQNNK